VHLLNTRKHVLLVQKNSVKTRDANKKNTMANAAADLKYNGKCCCRPKIQWQMLQTYAADPLDAREHDLYRSCSKVNYIYIYIYKLYIYILVNYIYIYKLYTCINYAYVYIYIICMYVCMYVYVLSSLDMYYIINIYYYYIYLFL
jgi:hypothetical protein